MNGVDEPYEPSCFRLCDGSQELDATCVCVCVEGRSVGHNLHHKPFDPILFQATG